MTREQFYLPRLSNHPVKTVEGRENNPSRGKWRSAAGFAVVTEKFERLCNS